MRDLGRRSAHMMQYSPHDDVAILLKLLLHLIGNLEFTRLVQEPHAFSHCQVASRAQTTPREHERCGLGTRLALHN